VFMNSLAFGKRNWVFKKHLVYLCCTPC
jgi:hypothetical protein